MRRSRPHWLQVLATVVLFALILAGYLAALRLTVESSRIDPDTTTNYRDAVALIVHGSALAVALVFGFVLGKWLNGLGFGYALLFASVMCVAMVATMAGSQALACEQGRNDLVRHWHC